MQDIAHATAEQARAIIQAATLPADLDAMAAAWAARLPDMAKAAKRRSAAFKAHASRAGGPRPPRAAPAPRPARATRAALLSSTFTVIVIADGISRETTFYDRDAAFAFASEQQAGQNGAPLPTAAAPRQRPRLPGKRRMVTREENQVTRGAAFRASCAAQEAAVAELGRNREGFAIWLRYPGAAHRVLVPDEVALFVTLNGKQQREMRERLYPAPRFWPDGAYPEGWEDLGPIEVAHPWKAEPGSASWRGMVDRVNAELEALRAAGVDMTDIKFRNIVEIRIGESLGDEVAAAKTADAWLKKLARAALAKRHAEQKAESA